MQSNFYETVQLIDKLMQQYSPENLENIEVYFDVSEGIKLYFLRKLSGYIESDFDPLPWFKPIYDKGYFNPQDNPKPYKLDNNQYKNPLWNVLPVLKKVAEINKLKRNEYSELILKIINSIINYKDKTGNSINNRITNYYITSIIEYLPVDMVGNDHLEFIRKELLNSGNPLISRNIQKNLLPNFLSNKSKDLVLHLLDIILDYKKIKNSYEPIMDKHWFNKSLELQKENIFKLCGIQASEIAIKNILKISDDVCEYTFSFFHIRAIENNPQNAFVDDYEFQLVFFVRDFYKNFNEFVNTDIKPFIRNLLKSESFILQRIGIYAINCHYNECNNIFWDHWINLNPLEENEYKHEIFKLFENRNNLFKKEEFETIIKWIENKNYHIDKDEPGYNKTLACQKLNWYSAFKKSSNDEIQNKYSNYKKICGSEPEHPSFSVWTEGLRAPYYPEEWCGDSSEEIIELMHKFDQNDQSDPIFLEGSSSRFLKNCTQNNPKKIVSHLDPFLDVSLKNQYFLLFGLLEAWREGKSFDWNNIFEFISSIINSESFWKESDSSDYKNEVIKVIADLIEVRTKNDDKPFGKELFPDVCKILIVLVNKTDSEVVKEEDLITAVINSAKGRVFSALINFSLSYARLYQRNNEDKLIPEIKKSLEYFLDNPVTEFSVTMGQFLPQIFYLNPKWAENNVVKIFSDKSFDDAFVGYMASPITIYESIYEILKEKKYLRKALNTEFKDRHTNKNLIYHICTAFLFDMENWEKDSLMSRLILRKDPEQLSMMVDYFLIQENNHNEEVKDKIKDLGDKIYEVASSDPEEYKVVLSNLSKWTIFFEDLDENLNNWLTSAAEFITPTDCRRLIKDLLRFANNKPIEVCEIYLKIIDDLEYPDYNVDDIKELVSILYKKENKNCANKICNYYGEKGFYFLKDSYMAQN